MKRVLTTATAIVAASALMVGCGDGNGTDNTNVMQSQSKTDIVTQEDARKAASLVKVMHFDTIAASMTQPLAIQQRNNVRITYPAPYEKVRECAAGGSVTTVGEKSNVFTYHATNSFLNCQHLDGLRVNGSQTVDATLENNRLAASLSDNVIVVSLGDMTMSIESDMKLYANRDLSIVETILLKDAIMYQYEINEESEGHMGAYRAVYKDFNVTTNALQQTMSLNGEVDIGDCGSYDIQTMDPITIGSNGRYTSGALNINGAQYVYNDDETVTVTVNENTTYTISQNIVRNLCDLEQKDPDPDRRFVRDDQLEVVVDNERGLMWQDNRAVTRLYKPWITSEKYNEGNYYDTSGDTASTYCSELVLGGYDDWRLPSVVELMSIKDKERQPVIDAAFQNVGMSTWSSESASNSDRAWYVGYGFSGDRAPFRKLFFLNVRCVRDGLD